MISMNTFWLKIAGIAVLVLVIIVLIGVFSSSEPGPEPEPEPKQKTVYDQWQQDDERLRAEPQVKESPETTSSVAQTTTKPQPEPQKPKFRELTIEEKVAADRLFEMAIAERKMGRLPGVKLGYKKMVDHCREIISRWPDSEYAFKAKRLLADIPPRYHERYNITKDEIDLSNLK